MTFPNDPRSVAASVATPAGLPYAPPPLRVARLRFELEPEAHLNMPLDIRGNVLRGAFGTTFQRLVCHPDCEGTASCSRRETCAYAMLFEPKWRIQSADFGAADAPRAFVFRPTQNPDPYFGPGQPLHFELRLFGQAIDVFPFFITAFQALARSRLQGVPVHLVSVQTLDWAGEPQGDLVSDGKVTRARPLILRLEDIQPPPFPRGPVRIRFFTPTWLRHDREDQPVPTLPALVCRLRDRLSFLSLLYEQQEWKADYAAIGMAARQARTSAHQGYWQDGARRSTRTGQVMPMAGFLGTVVYENLSPALWQLLAFGQEIHVGRYAVWGNGGFCLLRED